MWKSFVLELHGEWSEFADECIGLKATVERVRRRKSPPGGDESSQGVDYCERRKARRDPPPPLDIQVKIVFT